MIDVLILDAAGLLASFTFLIYSSWSDLKTREVPDRVWMIFYPVGIMLTATRLVVQANAWTLILISLFSTILISLLLPYLGFWGGADGKGLICLALMNPLIPTLGRNLSGIIDPFFPLVVFSNAYVASFASIIYPIQRNLSMSRRDILFEGFEHESFLHKLTAFLTGYKVSIEELEAKPHLFLMESVHRQKSTPTRRFKFDPTVNSDRTRELAEIREAGLGLTSDGIWVSPGLPFLIFVTLGLILTLLFGDIVWSFVSAIVHMISVLV